MIRNQWYVVLESDEVRRGKLLGVTRLGEKLVFWRKQDGQVVCMGDLCPHLGASLCQGKLQSDRLACPFHGFEFDSTGECKYLPAYGQNGMIPKALRTRIYPTYESQGMIWIFWGERKDVLEPPRFFEHSIPADCSYGRFRQHWNVHYSRVIENQLDVAHLPFVHYNTIGRGGRTVVDGPLVKQEGNLMHLWVFNRSDDGSPARKAEELVQPTRAPFLEFRFPNSWHNWISNDIHITIAFVPVDEENTLMYGRYYQRLVKLPLLRELSNLAGVISSRYIANQDRRIVNNQLPKKSSLRKMGEKIMQSDRGILAYRTHRQALKEAARQEE